MHGAGHPTDVSPAANSLLFATGTCSPEKPWGLHLFIVGHCPRCLWRPDGRAAARAAAGKSRLR
jgi:hypothetical protein